MDWSKSQPNSRRRDATGSGTRDEACRERAFAWPGWNQVSSGRQSKIREDTSLINDSKSEGEVVQPTPPGRRVSPQR